MGDEPEWRVFLAKVRGLRLPLGDYAVFESGPMVARGLIERAGDIDVLARGGAWERAESLGEVEMGERDPFVRLDGGIEIFGGWMGMDKDAIIDGATLVEGVPFARLEDVFAFKRFLRRAKDLDHIRIIESHLAKA